jgi:outer membrane protein assembly factor BamB
MVALSLNVRRICLIVLLVALYVFFALNAKAEAQGKAAVPAAPTSTAANATTVWTVKMSGDIRWQQITPAGALLVATDGSLAGIDIEHGKVTWEKPELAGLGFESVHPMDGSLLMEAERPGLLVIFDPVTGAVVFDSQKLAITKIVTKRVLPQSGTLLVHGLRAGQGSEAPPVVALYDLASGQQLWVNESLFTQSEAPKKRGFGALMQNLTRLVSGGTELEVLQSGPETIIVHTLMGLRSLDARTGAVRWSASLPTQRGMVAKQVRLYQSIDKADRIYVSFDDSLMAYKLADGQPLWAKPAKIDGRIRDIVQHPNGIVMLPQSPPADEATGNVRIVNGVVQTGINVARYEDGTTIADKPVRMHGSVIDALVAGNSVVLQVDAESKTFVNVLDVSTATLRLKKDAKIKGQLAYAELTPAGLLYVSRPDATVNAEVNIIDLESGQQRFKDAIESGKPLSGNADDYNAARYYLHTAVEEQTLYVFANRDHRLYAVDRTSGSFRPVSNEIKLQGGEDPLSMEIRPEGIVLTSSQNLVVVSRDGQIKKQAYYPAPQLPGILRALYAVNAVRAGLYGAAASAYGDAFAQASRQACDPTMRHVSRQLAAAYTEQGRQLEGYSRQSAALATKRFKASLDLPNFVFMLTKAPEGKGNVLLEIDKDTAQPRARVNLGKENEPTYAVDDIADMLFLETTPGTLVGYRLDAVAEDARVSTPRSRGVN